MTRLISPKLWYNIKELVLILAFWEMSFKILAFFIFLGGDAFGHPVYHMGNFFTQENIFFIHPELLSLSFMGFFIGIITGITELFLFPKMFKRRTFITALLIKKGIYVITILFVSLTIILIKNILIHHLSFSQVITDIPATLKKSGFLLIFIYGLITSLGINFLLQIKNKIGPRVLIELIMGKYHQPKSEERIFMFIDLKSSTEIAENLGHVKFSMLLQDCYSDISDIVINYGAQIYQYVGDEVVLTWKLKKGKDSLKCIHLFFVFKSLLQKRKSFYQKKYGLSPEFKASLNSGNVSTAEVGIVKSEIAYHGDVLNTAARIEKECQVFNVDLIASESFIKLLAPSSNGFNHVYLGEVLLKGKHNPINIYGIEKS